ncbi:MAG TPA: hypothetical protein VFP69_20760 [Streptomyces sp.]|nr:hypothetical protein [Streptomyces sp.]
MNGRRAGAGKISRRIGTMVAAAALALTGVTMTAGAAQAQTQKAEAANCWGSYTISPDGWGFIQASSSTFCDHTAWQLGVKLTVRQRDPFGYVSTCGTYDLKTAFNATQVMATVRCISNGAGYTYWAYSENWADIDGQHISFNSGNWNG